ncbi:MAG TPA: hypothetical protein DCY93_01505 [Firmicutes bacterium]|nr:hypothetical protein [Bacillota bacterium]
MIVLTGASASGKTEVAKLLNLKYNIKKVVTHTTRQIRLGEKDGVDYHFVSKQEFQAMIKENKFVEWMIYNDNYYGTSKDEIADDKAVIVDPNGVQVFQNLKSKSIIVFRLLASDTTRFNRMLVRGDTLEIIKKRIESDKTCFSDEKYNNIQYTIDTDKYTIEEVTDKIFEIYTKSIHQRA